MRLRWAYGVLLFAAACKLAVALRWGLIADEAYHWTWALSPGWGYYDQPPLVAWALAVQRAAFGDSAPALRLGPILAWLAAVGALLPWARDRGLWLAWALLLPPLAVLTNLAVPDALLLAAWAGGLAAALGRRWVLAGVMGGLASLAKHDGALLVPLLILGADASERRTRGPWVALLVAALMLTPNLVWNATHDWVTLRFQLGEGLLAADPPGVWGPLRVALDQTLVVGPIGFGAGVAWLVRGWEDRADRLCAAVSAPVLVAFALAAIGGPPEAHWPAPAWIGVGLGLARAGGRLRRAAWVGAWLGGFATLGILAHAEHPLVSLATDPAVRLSEGRVLGEGVARWSLPAVGEPGEPVPVVTERYQEAALVRWTTGVEAFVLPGCGRRSQYDLAPRSIPERALFVRPARSGPPRCAQSVYGTVSSPRPIRGTDDAGRVVGPWQVFEVRDPR